MELPWPSFVLLVVPPAVLFVVALVHWLWPSREAREGSEAKLPRNEAR